MCLPRPEAVQSLQSRRRTRSSQSVSVMPTIKASLDNEICDQLYGPGQEVVETASQRLAAAQSPSSGRSREATPIIETEVCIAIDLIASPGVMPFLHPCGGASSFFAYSVIQTSQPTITSHLIPSQRLQGGVRSKDSRRDRKGETP